MTIRRDNGSLRRQDARSAQDSASRTEDTLQSHDHDSNGPVDAPLPRPKRQRRRAKADRGLPPDEELAKLATAYLRRQRDHWPKLVEIGLLPEPTDAVIRQMVEDFKRRFWISLIMSLPIVALAPMIQEWLGLREALAFPGSSFVQFALSSLVFLYGGWPFLKGLVDELR